MLTPKQKRKAAQVKAFMESSKKYSSELKEIPKTGVVKGLMNAALKKANELKSGERSRVVSKSKGLATKSVDGSEQVVREKTKIVQRRTGTTTSPSGDKTPVLTTKKIVVKGKGVGSNNPIEKYKSVKRFN